MKERITITIDEEILDLLDEVSKKFGVSRSKLTENLFMMGLSDMKILKNLRFIDAAYAVTQVREYLKKVEKDEKLKPAIK